jgi:sugar O-acyltransferase (sialic acid O-acetyltransferase NeuD family)
VTADAPIVLYGVGSPLVVDAEESCARAGIAIAAGVRNVDAPVYTSDAVRVIARDAVTERERACGFVVALFTPHHRSSAVDDALRAGFMRGATLVDPTAPVARAARLGEGVYVNAGAVVAAACDLGDWVLVNRSASIGHHARIGAFASIGPGAVLCGQVVVGRGAVIGAGSVVLPKVEIGDNAVIAAGSVVREPVPANCLAEGNPCRVVRTHIKGYGRLAV